VVRFLPVDVVKGAQGGGATLEMEMVGDEVRIRASIDTETLLALVRAKC